ncbi:MAG: FG-GAP repeat protein [Thermoplasmata archaeon]|nr:MAG: FG-GAP repeat protein [Thermoplasmata archaeon]
MINSAAFIFSGCSATNEQYGLWFDITSNHNLITYNNFTSNNMSGIFLRNSKHNSIINNSFNSNTQNGILLYISESNSIYNNTLVNSSYSAINLNYSCNNVLAQNTIIENNFGIILTEDMDYIFTGEAAGDEFGWSVSGAGDVNNDGFDDIIVGARSNGAGGSNAGRAYVYSGLSGEILHTFTGEPGGKMGQSVSWIGDINKVGYDDVIVGAHGTNGWRGRAYVYSGQTGETLYTFDGEFLGDNLGIYVSGAGDVDKDGYVDVIVGASDNDAGGSSAGRAYVYSGKTGNILYTFTGEAAEDKFGFSVSDAGDLNNDGFDDVIVGAHLNDAGGNNAGRAYVFSGFNGSLLYNFTGESSDDYFGSRVSSAGDVNNDGFDDIIVGAHGVNSWSGKAYIYSGYNGELIHNFTGEENVDWLGFGISGCEDLDSDGFDDVIIGAHFYSMIDANVGRVYVHSGLDGSLQYLFDGEAYNDRFGCSVSGVSDVNNDGFNDFIIGAYFNDAGGEDAGRAYVFSSRSQGSNDNIITDNNIINNTEYGIYIINSTGNSIYHNKIINNTNQAFDNTNDQNLWDAGYPMGGNYWSDYSGVDNFKGPDQDQPGSDGIGDINYSIDPNSRDNYPLMDPSEYVPYENYTILTQGWNLISIPLIQQEQGITKVIQSIDGYYNALQWYNVTDNLDPWTDYTTIKSFGNDLYKLNETMGFWIYITKPGETIFLYNGTQPNSNQTIQFHPGWNMVGYPSLTNHNRTAGLNNLTFGMEVDAIQWYDASTKTWHDMNENDYFEPGKGYWVHSKVECKWEVPL